MENAVEMRGICKSFGGMFANDHVDFTLREGEIHSLLGENGAGKTTLMNALYGLYTPETGEIRVRGQKVKVESPLKAIAYGIGMVHQHFMLVEPLSVYENIVLGYEEARYGFLTTGTSKEAIRKLAEECGLQIDLDAQVANLSIGAKQRVEILKILYRGAKILIMDEPTAVLTPQETDELFVILKQLKARGNSIILITHKLRETFATADRITVMRRGKVVSTSETADTTAEELGMLMVGRAVNLKGYAKGQQRGEVLLHVENLNTCDREQRNLENVSFDIRSGEILGIAGVDGNGQSQLMKAMIGISRPKCGRVLLEGKDITYASPAGHMRAGVAIIPENRNVMGLVPDFTVTENVLLGSQDSPPFNVAGFVQWHKAEAYTRRLMAQFDIVPRVIEMPARTFSGGNQQKIIVARELSLEGARLVVAVQPTRGLDIGATEFVHKELLRMRDQGAAILLISTELDEVRSLSDRIAVMYDGKLVALNEADSFDEQQLGLLMAGNVCTKEGA